MNTKIIERVVFVIYSLSYLALTLYIMSDQSGMSGMLLLIVMLALYGPVLRLFAVLFIIFRELTKIIIIPFCLLYCLITGNAKILDRL